MQGGGDKKVAICIVVGIILCFGLPFIICDLVFANNDPSECLNENLHAVSFTLKTWLEVDAYVRIATIALCICFVIMLIAAPDAAGGFAICFGIYTCLAGLFTLAWFIIGAIIFWGQLNPEGTCTSSLNSYMWVLLIFSALGICCQLGNSGQQQRR